LTPVFRKAPFVNSDMRAIGRYTQKQWGTTQRKEYLARLVRRFERLAEQPQAGSACDEIREGYRKSSPKAGTLYSIESPMTGSSKLSAFCINGWTISCTSLDC
jgi:toxin ParE1/3/4